MEVILRCRAVLTCYHYNVEPHGCLLMHVYKKKWPLKTVKLRKIVVCL